MDEINKKLFVVILDGYSASVKKNDLLDVFKRVSIPLFRTHKISSDDVICRYESARLSSSKKRKIVKFLNDYNTSEYVVLFIGKSYGAKVLVKILNSIKLNFYKTYVLTIEPCWPKFFNWAPNLNEEALVIKNRDVDEIFNIYLLRDPDKQAGCPVYHLYKDVRVTNCKIYSYGDRMYDSWKKEYTHKTIINAEIVKLKIEHFLKRYFFDVG